MLGAQQRNQAPDPAPKQGAGQTWATILGMLASRDPGSVLAQDAAQRSAAVDAWQRRQAARDDSAFGRQAQAAGLLMRQDDATRAAEAQTFQQDRATAADIERANEVDYRHGRDQVTDQHWTAEQKRAAEQFDATQTGLDRRAQLMYGDRAAHEARIEAYQKSRDARADASEIAGRTVCARWPAGTRTPRCNRYARR